MANRMISWLGLIQVAVPDMDEALLKRILGICWSNLEDPLTQTVRQVQSVFQELAAVQVLNGEAG